MQPIPPTLASVFQEYDFAKLNPQADAHTIIERTLQFGNRAELRWLFASYSEEQIRAWVRRFGEEVLPQPHHTFWRAVLEISK
ncbi:MAG: hypothetical protein HY869_07485 [Chloroflexi bacterium]|nr:hypothetical protein [Chloroflexota bacterium]